MQSPSVFAQSQNKLPAKCDAANRKTKLKPLELRSYSASLWCGQTVTAIIIHGKDAIYYNHQYKLTPASAVQKRWPQINYGLILIGCIVSGLASQQRGFNSRLVLSVWSLHVLPVYVWLLSGYSGFLPPSKHMHVRLIGESKLSVGVNVSWTVVCLSVGL